MKSPDDIVFLLDCDNTLLDNDRVQDDLRSHLEREFGCASSDRYWAIFEELRTELGYADYLGALQRYRLGDMSAAGPAQGANSAPRGAAQRSNRPLSSQASEDHTYDPRLLLMSAFLVDYPFADRLYPGALAAIAHFRRWGPTVILSDGDVIFQPRKIQRSGLWHAVDGQVLIYIHKEKMLDAVEKAYPARHYVMVDDKLRILAAMKEVWGDRLTTVFPRQGHYAFDAKNLAAYPPAALTVERIGDLVGYDLVAFL